MNIVKRALFAAALLAAASLPALAGPQIPESELASLQAAMQSHIDQMSVDGALLHLDAATGKVRAVYPAKAHPMIMMAGKYYYLCANFRDAEGKEVMVNFYAAKEGDRYVFFYTDFTGDEALEHKVEKHAGLDSN